MSLSKTKVVNHASTTEDEQQPGEFFDLTGTMKRLGNDRGILRDLIRMFKEDSPVLLDRLRSAVQARNCEQARHAAHSLRGLASNFGAEELSRPLREIEDLAAKEQTEQMPEWLEKAERERERLEKLLQPYQ